MNNTKRVYVAGSLYQKERVKSIYQILKDHGYQISSDWTIHKPIDKEISDKALAEEYAIEDVEGIKSADIFILLLDNNKSLGAHLELGVALALEHIDKYMIDEASDDSIFYYHPKITRCKSFEEALNQINPG